MSVSTYAGPACRTCCDLLPNDQFPRADGTWEDHRAAGKVAVNRQLFMSKARASSETCSKCALLVEAVSKFEGNAFEIDNDFIAISGKLGKPYYLDYEVDELPKSIELFSGKRGEAGQARLFQSGDGIGPAPFIHGAMETYLAATLTRAWLDTCERSHQHCGPRAEPNLPTRVIHVGSGQDNPRLYESRGEAANYVALSYCWGTSQPLLTTKGNKASRIEGIPLRDFPKTLREAVLFTWSLGISYIWIDALCIVQDDTEDWQREAAKMKTVYENAVLTLSAASSPDVHSGCFLPRKDQCYELKDTGIFARRPCRDTHELLFAPSNNQTHSRRHAAMSRGWIFQERLLAKRILYCSHDELIWECAQEVWCECSSQEVYAGSPIAKYRRQDWLSQGPGRAFSALSMWLDLLESYVHREFTHYTDRAVAISGIAQKFQPLGLGEYQAGVWSEFLPWQLSWARWPGYRVSESARIGSPTWSWTSINQPAHFKDILPQERVKIVMRVLGCEVVLQAQDPYGAVSSARLKIFAPAVQGMVVLEPNQMSFEESYYTTYAGAGDPDALDSYVRVGSNQFRMTTDVCQFASGSVKQRGMQTKEILLPNERVVCAQLYEARDWRDAIERGRDYRCPWLVLRWSHADNAYRRVGLIDLTNRLDYKRELQSPDLMSESAEEKYLEIV